MSEIKPWKTLSSETVLDSEYYKVRKDVCQLPNGIIIQDYYVRELNEIAFVLCATKEKKIVLVRQYRYGAGEVTLELPGGIQTAHDLNIAETARRELMEETGYSSEYIQECGTLWLEPASCATRAHLFYAPEAEKIGAPKGQSRERTEVQLKPFDELRALISEGKINTLAHVAAISYLLDKISDEIKA